MRKLRFVSMITLITLLSFTHLDTQAESLNNSHASTVSELIDAVNSLRVSNGLNPYTPNPILMNLAQAQAEYNISIGTTTHFSANGLRPFQRALLAGYAVAGDISLGGFYSENIAAGVGLTAEEAVKNWTGDAPHLNTMMATNLRDIGAGVAFSGDTFYYVIDCGLSTGGTPAAFTPPPSYSPPRPTIMPNTPNADGSITYTVQSGDTLLGVAIAYNIPLSDLLAVNGLTIKSTIYTGQKLIIRAGYTPTPTLPTLTPTSLFTITPWSTTTQVSTVTPIPPTPSSSPVIPRSFARTTVTILVLSALFLSACFVLLGLKRK